MKKVVYALVAALAASVVQAGPTADFLKSVLAKSAAATPGRWNSDFAKCKKYCEDNGVPFVAVWSNGDACGHCTAFEKACEKSYFKNWQKKSGIVFWFGCPSNGYKMDDAVSAFKWTRANSGRQSYTSGGPQTSFPFVRIYWPKGKVDVSTVGDTMRGGFSSNADTSAKKITQYIDGKLKVGKSGGWAPAGETPKYLGGVFDPTIDNVEGARMEIETGLTTNITITLVRTNANSVAHTATNFLHVAGSTLAGGQREIYWASGVDTIGMVLPVAADGTGDLVVTLYDNDNTTLKDTFTVKRVAKKENSPENPLFVGKESEGLGWGQWSMDLDAVTNKVANENGNLTSAGKPRLGVTKTAYAVVLFGGAMWCPDCAKSDEYFFRSTEFHNWAVDNNIALGVVDIPNLPNQTTSPCLLTTISATTGAGNFHGYSKRSGLDYLTRHMISADEAQAVYDRNVFLASHNVLDGGWNRPERANQNRPGVPTLLLMRGDGSIAGRFTALATASPTSTANNAAYIKRLNELLEQAKDASEESSDGFMTTPLFIDTPSVVTNTLSAVDAADCYSVRKYSNAGRLVATVRLFDAELPCHGTLQVIAVNNSRTTVLASTNFTAESSGTVVAFVDQGTDAYINVLVNTQSSSPQSSLREGSTVSPYELAAEIDDKYHVMTLSYGDELVGADMPDRVGVPEGGVVASLPCPVRDHYKFVGWFTGEDEGLQIKDGDHIDEDLVLYARWVPVFTIDFELNLMDGENYLDDDTGDCLLDGWVPSVTADSGTIVSLPGEGIYSQGRHVAGWATNAFGAIEYWPGDEIVLESDMTLYAVWAGASGLRTSDSGGDAVWVYEGGGVWRSGVIGNSEESWLEVAVEGRAVVSFEWMASSEQYDGEVFDYVYLSIDGEPQGRLFYDETIDRYVLEGGAIGGECDWSSWSVNLTEPGVHTIRWTYVKDDVDESDTGADCAWIANINVEPFYAVSFDINGAEGETPEGFFASEGDVITLPEADGFAKAKYTFQGWNCDADGSIIWADYEMQYTMPAGDVVFTAEWEANVLEPPGIWSDDVEDGDVVDAEYVIIEMFDECGGTILYTVDGSDPAISGILYTGPFAVYDLFGMIRAISVGEDYFNSEEATFTFTRVPNNPGECLNMMGRNVTTGGTQEGWFRVLGDDAHDGVAALRSGAVGDGETSFVEMEVSGSGEVSFWWKVSSEISRNRKYDYVSFLVDGVERSWLGGEKDWTNEVFAVTGSGMHTLRWVYQKNENGLTQGEDCAWLDNVAWMSDDPLPEIVSNSEVMNALAGAGDEVRLKAHIGSKAQYDLFRAWVDGKGLDHQAVKDSPRAWFSYAIGANGLVEGSFQSGDVEVASVEAPVGGVFTFKVRVKNVPIGSEATPANLATVFEVQGSSSLAANSFSSKNVNAVLGVSEDGQLIVSATPIGSFHAFFVRVRMYADEEMGDGDDVHAKVQLWEGGPYWATTNIGAENPEDYGYYFWWGDTVGYKRENDAWVASDGSSANYTFEATNTPTYGKDTAALQNEGWITADGVLAPEHDAAQVHWGDGWRMPTEQELDDLSSKCNWKWTTINGVNGYEVQGNGAYAFVSIFLPAAGYGDGSSLGYSGSSGYYWSSVPYSESYASRRLTFSSSGKNTLYAGRGHGFLVRPVQGFNE